MLPGNPVGPATGEGSVEMGYTEESLLQVSCLYKET